MAQVRSRNCHGRSISAERVLAGKFSYRKPIISSITACQMLLKADLLSQSTILCRQLLWSCADLFQADRDLAAAFYCGSGKFSYRKPIISSITACQMLLKADLLSQSTILCRQLLWSCADLFQADRDLVAALSVDQVNLATENL